MLPMFIVKIADILGPSIVIILSFMIVYEATLVKRKAEGLNVWYFIYWFAIAEVVFAIGRSLGHIAKHIILSAGGTSAWKILGAFSGSINTITFVIVFTVSLITAYSMRQFSK